MAAPLGLNDRDVLCPLCGNKYVYWTPKSHSTALIRRDTDQCPYYTGLNPLFYMVYVCPSCHFAAYKEHFKTLEEASKAALILLLKEDALGLAVNFNAPERTIFPALRSFQLALSCYEVRGFPPEIRAGVALRAGWLCRYSGQLRRELLFVERARDLYLEAFEKGLRVPGASDLSVAFLIGELMLRTGQISEAQKFFMLLLKAPDSRESQDRNAQDRLYDSKQFVRVKGILDRVDVLASMGEQGRGLLAVNTEVKELSAGETICAKGEKGDSMFVVASGNVSVYLEDPSSSEPIKVLGPGETIGEMSLFSGEKRSATVIAGAHGNSGKRMTIPGAVELVEIGHPAVRNLLKAVPAVVQGIAEIITARKVQNAQINLKVQAKAMAAAVAPAASLPLGLPETAAADFEEEGVAATDNKSVLVSRIRKFFGVSDVG